MTAYPDELDPRTISDSDEFYYLSRYVHDRYARGRYVLGRVRGPFTRADALKALDVDVHGWVNSWEGGRTATGDTFDRMDAYVCTRPTDEDEYPSLILVLTRSGVPLWWRVAQLRHGPSRPSAREDSDL